MKFLSALLLTVTLACADCPEPPPGHDPYPEVPGTPGLIQVPSACYYPPAAAGGVIKTALRIEFRAEAGKYYEVQYTRSLAPADWKTYANISLGYSAIVLTDHPIYTCETMRFFRVVSN